MDTIEFFEKNGYVVLSGALSKDECKKLTDHMFDLQKQGKTTKDEQCPLSDAVYGDPIFDDLLQKFAKPIGKQVGKELLPTYTYARIYRPGEVLKKHKDRPACEISATMTLGFDAEPIWPILFDEEKRRAVELDVGELAVYKGCDIAHWRNEFKGQWHVQLFMHYVDANGPYKDHYKDGRDNFGTLKGGNVQNNNQDAGAIRQEDGVVRLDPNRRFGRPIHHGVIIPNPDEHYPGYMCIDKGVFPELRFTKEECEKIISLSRKSYGNDASIGTVESAINTKIRSAEIYNIEHSEENAWIHDKIARIISIANTIHFDFDISGILHGIQLIHYKSKDDTPGHYDWHVDAGPGNAATRKISFTAQLSDANDYEGCELIINNHGVQVTATKEQGSVHLFPSFMLHKVTPITKGDRFALVIWIHGYRRFK